MLALRINRCRCSHASRTLARTYSTESSIPALPPGAKWKVEFPIQNTLRRERPVMHNPESAREVARSFLSKPAIADGGKIVIEAFPGPGALSRAMLELPESKLSKLIILEDDPVYLNGLKPLEEADSRVKVVPMSGHVWDTYTHLEEHGYLEGLKPQPIEGPIPNLHFVAHLPQSVKGEQLIAQLFRCIPEQSWLFQYGRVPMSFLLNNLMYGRVTARPKAKARCKLSVIAEACAEVEDAVDPEMLAPYEEHFYPLPAASGIQKPSTKRVGQPMHAITATPYSEQVIQRGEIDKWDYCLRRLFVLKTTPLKTALSSLAPGATSLLKDLTSGGLPSSQRVNVAKTIKDLTVADWTLILRAFNNWPFRPEDLMITDGFKDSE
ncbi:S-adenosyl-L-methionine-dependent methyltransferase [Trametes coccinea BRFM310]|uniref:rRNA adenine N(6)-methyltransferase n=1 Tax=Trametes coccinea (strain BRFM310) TaxID=1353009 RepID=A0A1Y2IVT0_TRAC3|nr:S-adenosyl-L-methionine-dependent methyltransferase [Trametes coccinea BRFM310]